MQHANRGDNLDVHFRDSDQPFDACPLLRSESIRTSNPTITMRNSATLSCTTALWMTGSCVNYRTLKARKSGHLAGAAFTRGNEAGAASPASPRQSLLS